MDKSLYYDPNKLLSYNRILNFVIGARGIGKSYGFKKYVVNRFLKHGKQFIYLRRYKGELVKLPQWFNDIKQEFPDTEFKVKGRQLFINNKLAGWGIPLSAWQSEKSNAYPEVKPSYMMNLFGKRIIVAIYQMRFQLYLTLWIRFSGIEKT
jgi:hypothetical protein